MAILSQYRTDRATATGVGPNIAELFFQVQILKIICWPLKDWTNLSTIAVIYVTKSRTGNYDFRACARARGFPGSTLFGRTHMLRRVCRAITR